MDGDGQLQGALIDWLKAVNLRANYAKQLGGDMVRPLGLALADRLLTVKVACGLGLAGEVYRMSESSGVHTASLPNYSQRECTRVPLHVTTLLQICVRGCHIMIGYLIDEAKTRKAIAAVSSEHAATPTSAMSKRKEEQVKADEDVVGSGMSCACACQNCEVMTDGACRVG